MEIRISKAWTSLDVDVDGLQPNVVEYVIRYGLTQILNDAHSQVTRESHPDDDARAAECLALAQKKLDAMIAGEVRTQTRTGDAVMAEAIRMATATVKAAFRRAGIKMPDAKTLRARAEAYLAKHPELVDAARTNIETAKTLAEGVEL